LLTLSCWTPSAPPEIYTLSLHDALPISIDADLADLEEEVLGDDFDDDDDGLDDDDEDAHFVEMQCPNCGETVYFEEHFLFGIHGDRKSTRLNSSHVKISYAVFCLKKKKE